MSFTGQTLGLWVGVTLTDGWMSGRKDGQTDGLTVRCVSNRAYVII
jgi:hypothetical protein